MIQEALKLALEAMEYMAKIRDCQREAGYPLSDADKGLQKAITAIKEALAQPAQEPVAWMYDWFCDGKLITGWIAHSEPEIPKSMALNIRPLYTTPPQRPWVGLTDEQREACTQSPFTEDNYQDIEDKLKELNT